MQKQNNAINQIARADRLLVMGLAVVLALIGCFIDVPFVPGV